MLTKNLDIQKGHVNGARGIVIGYEASIQGESYLLPTRFFLYDICVSLFIFRTALNQLPTNAF